MAAKRKYEGPYRARRTGVNGDSWHVVYQVSDKPDKNVYQELIPPREFKGKNARKMAVRSASNLNKQEEVNA